MVLDELDAPQDALDWGGLGGISEPSAGHPQVDGGGRHVLVAEKSLKLGQRRTAIELSDGVGVAERVGLFPFGFGDAGRS